MLFWTKPIPGVLLDNYSKVFEACYSTQLMSFHLDLPLAAISAVCHQFGLLSTDLRLIPWTDFIETFNYGFYFLLFLS